MNYPKFDQFHRFCFLILQKKRLILWTEQSAKCTVLMSIVQSVLWVTCLFGPTPRPIVYHIEACDQPIDFVLSKPRPSQVVRRAIKSLSVFDVSKSTKRRGMSQGNGFGFFDYTYCVSRKRSTE